MKGKLWVPAVGVLICGAALGYTGEGSNKIVIQEVYDSNSGPGSVLSSEVSVTVIFGNGLKLVSQPGERTVGIFFPSETPGVYKSPTAIKDVILQVSPEAIRLTRYCPGSLLRRIVEQAIFPDGRMELEFRMNYGDPDICGSGSYYPHYIVQISPEGERMAFWKSSITGRTTVESVQELADGRYSVKDLFLTPFLFRRWLTDPNPTLEKTGRRAASGDEQNGQEENLQSAIQSWQERGERILGSWRSLAGAP